MATYSRLPTRRSGGRMEEMPLAPGVQPAHVTLSLRLPGVER
jgi:hypothetical protein